MQANTPPCGLWSAFKYKTDKNEIKYDNNHVDITITVVATIKLQSINIVEEEETYENLHLSYNNIQDSHWLDT